jgi:hypothetical protein
MASLKIKKGFIIDGTIVLNRQFDSIVFHEFGHYYYARWLSSIIQEHMLLLWRMYRIYEYIPWYRLCTTGLKHSETDVVEEVFGSTRTRRHKNLEKLLQGIDPQDNLAIARSVDDFTETF